MHTCTPKELLVVMSIFYLLVCFSFTKGSDIAEL